MEQPVESEKRTPVWVPIVLGVQFFLAIVILGLSAYICHGKYFNSLGFAIFISLLTWLVVVYKFLTLYVGSLKQYQHQYASLAINAVMAVFWLATMGAAAALRASFKYSVTIDGCYNDGSLVNSETCVVERDLHKRAAVATQAGLAMMSAIAGLSALEWLLYVAFLVVGILEWNKTRSRTPATGSGPAPQKTQEGYENYRMETPQQPYVQPAQPVMQQQQYQQPVQPQQPYVQQTVQPQQPYVQHQQYTDVQQVPPTTQPIYGQQQPQEMQGQPQQFQTQPHYQ